jgi:hypothetical protein
MASPTLLKFLRDFPWIKNVAIASMATGLLGLIAFGLTARKMRTEEERCRRLAQSNWMRLNPTQFEHYVADLMHMQGYKVKVVGRTADGGIDIQFRSPAGEKGIAQVKRYNHENKVGVKHIREFRTVLRDSKADLGYFITSGRFTGPAMQEGRKNRNLELIDYQGLSDWMKAVKAGPYSDPAPRPPLLLTASQWLTLSLLMTAAVGSVTFAVFFFLHR